MEDIEIEAMIWHVVSKEIKEPVTEFVINKKVREKLNLGENQRSRVTNLIEKLHRDLFIISTEDINSNVLSIKASSETKYFANPDKVVALGK